MLSNEGRLIKYNCCTNIVTGMSSSMRFHCSVSSGMLVFAATMTTWPRTGGGGGAAHAQASASLSLKAAHAQAKLTLISIP